MNLDRVRREFDMVVCLPTRKRSLHMDTESCPVSGDIVSLPEANRSNSHNSSCSSKVGRNPSEHDEIDRLLQDLTLGRQGETPLVITKPSLSIETLRKVPSLHSKSSRSALRKIRKSDYLTSFAKEKNFYKALESSPCRNSTKSSSGTGVTRSRFSRDRCSLTTSSHHYRRKSCAGIIALPTIEEFQRSEFDDVRFRYRSHRNGKRSLSCGDSRRSANRNLKRNEKERLPNRNTLTDVQDSEKPVKSRVSCFTSSEIGKRSQNDVLDSSTLRHGCKSPTPTLSAHGQCVACDFTRNPSTQSAHSQTTGILSPNDRRSTVPQVRMPSPQCSPLYQSTRLTSETAKLDLPPCDSTLLMGCLSPNNSRPSSTRGVFDHPIDLRQTKSLPKMPTRKLFRYLSPDSTNEMWW